MHTVVPGGFELLPTSTLCNVLAAVEQKLISGKALRTFCAVVTTVASRNASRHSSKETHVHFTVDELIELTKLPRRIIKKSLRQLHATGIVSWSAQEVTIERPIQAYSNAQVGIIGETSAKRLVPLPRRVLRFLARCRKASLIRVMLAYMVRGLRRSKKDGINNKGAVKCSWIVELTGLCLRSVQTARKALIDLGWLSKDTSSTQRKLNRTGSYFVINVEWAERSLQANVGGEKKEPLFASPPPQKRTLFASPIKKQRTSYGSTKTKITQSLKEEIPPDGSGFCKKISFKNIKPEYLKTVSGVFALYHSALKLKLFTHSEQNLLNFFAAAVKAKRSWRNSVAMFVWTVKNGFQFITDQDEIRAQEILKKNNRRKFSESFENLQESSEMNKGFVSQCKKISQLVNQSLIGTQAFVSVK